MDDLNSTMLSLIPGESQVFLSRDTLTTIKNGDTSKNMNPPKLLHSLNFPRLSNHRLELKMGAPIILFRNLNQSVGLCNGPRMIVHKLGNKVIKARVISESNNGETVLIHVLCCPQQRATIRSL